MLPLNYKGNGINVCPILEILALDYKGDCTKSGPSEDSGLELQRKLYQFSSIWKNLALNTKYIVPTWVQCCTFWLWITKELVPF